LKTSRLVKRRALAKELCDEGAVLVNGRPSRAGRELAPGDEVTLNLRNRQLSVAVGELPTERKVGVSEATDLYKVIRDERRGGDGRDHERAD
jgi:ribosomal 50S subunit-recycling heat shock protein